MELIDQIEEIQETIAKAKAIIIAASANDNFVTLSPNIQLTLIHFINEILTNATVESEKLFELATKKAA